MPDVLCINDDNHPWDLDGRLARILVQDSVRSVLLFDHDSVRCFSAFVQGNERCVTVAHCECLHACLSLLFSFFDGALALRDAHWLS